MTTSGTATWEESRDEILAEALENVGAIGPGDVRDSNNSALFDVAARCLNRVVKSIDKDGHFLWKFVRRTTTTTDGTASFVLGTDVLTVDPPMRIVRSGETSGTTIDPMPRDEYMELSDRTKEGLPSQYFVEYALGTRTVYLYPTPDATGDTIEYVAVLRGQDFTSGAETADFTSKWGSCLVYGTTMELAPKFNQDPDKWERKYEMEKVKLNNDDVERGGISFVPFQGYRSGAG